MTRAFNRKMLPGLLLGGVLGAWFISGVQWHELFEALRTVHPAWVALAGLLVLNEWVMRGLRWWVMLRPVDPTLPIGLPISATLVGAGANVLIPLRGGDLLRPAMITALRGIPFTVALSSTILERLLDVAGTLAILASVVVTLPPASETPDTVDHIRIAIQGLVASGVVLLLLVGILATGTMRPVVERFAARLPAGRPRDRAIGLYEEILIGLRSVGSIPRLLVCVGLTVIVWGSGVAAVAAVLRAFSLDELPIETSLFVLGSVNLAIAVPQAPGFLGVFQVVVERALSLWPADHGAAQAVALVYWGVCFVPVVLIGLFEGWRLGFRIGESTPEKILDGRSEGV